MYRGSNVKQSKDSFHRKRPSEKIETDPITLTNEIVYRIGKEWMYYLGTKSKGILQVCSEKKHTSFKIYYILPLNVKEPNEVMAKEAKEFADLLVREAQKQVKCNLFNVNEELKKNDGRLCYLHNIFFRNVRSAGKMLSLGIAYESDKEKEAEKRFLKEITKLDLGNIIITDEMAEEFLPSYNETMDVVTLKGAYCYASIFYFILAVESFGNIIYHVFLKDGLRKKNVEDRIQKMDPKDRTWLNVVARFIGQKIECLMNQAATLAREGLGDVIAELLKPTSSRYSSCR